MVSSTSYHPSSSQSSADVVVGSSKTVSKSPTKAGSPKGKGKKSPQKQKTSAVDKSDLQAVTTNLFGASAAASKESSETSASKMLSPLELKQQKLKKAQNTQKAIQEMNSLELTSFDSVKEFQGACSLEYLNSQFFFSELLSSLQVPNLLNDTKLLIQMLSIDSTKQVNSTSLSKNRLFSSHKHVLAFAIPLLLEEKMTELLLNLGEPIVKCLESSPQSSLYPNLFAEKLKAKLSTYAMVAKTLTEDTPQSRKLLVPQFEDLTPLLTAKELENLNRAKFVFSELLKSFETQLNWSNKLFDAAVFLLTIRRSIIYSKLLSSRFSRFSRSCCRSTIPTSRYFSSSILSTTVLCHHQSCFALFTTA